MQVCPYVPMPEQDLNARSLTLHNDSGPVVTIGLAGNNEHPQRMGRLRYGFHGNYPAEIEIDCGPDTVGKGNIISQIMQWGPRTKDGTGRGRITVGITADKDGGLSAVIDSSTNDTSGSVGQQRAIPLALNVGEANGVYVVLFANGTLKIQDRARGDLFEGTVKQLSDAIRKVKR